VRARYPHRAGQWDQQDQTRHRSRVSAATPLSRWLIWLDPATVSDASSVVSRRRGCRCRGRSRPDLDAVTGALPGPAAPCPARQLRAPPIGRRRTRRRILEACPRSSWRQAERRCTSQASGYRSCRRSGSGSCRWPGLPRLRRRQVTPMPSACSPTGPAPRGVLPTQSRQHRRRCRGSVDGWTGSRSPSRWPQPGSRFSSRAAGSCA
jgi:hypothetical protein